MYTSPKASETRGVMLVVDDAKNVADQLKDLLNAEIKVKVFTDLHPLLETLESTSQVAEKGLGKAIAYLKGASEIRKCRELWMDSRERHNSRYINKNRIKEGRYG